MEPVEAWVLHARAWRESSQLVELLTVEHGRIGVLTRGNRGAKRTHSLQPFRRYRLVLAGRGELRRVSSSEALGAPCLLAGHALYAALYLNEVLVRLLHRDLPVPGVVELYAATVSRLAGGEDLEPALRVFEKQLLDELGYGHRWTETVDGRPVSAAGRYTFDPARGVREAAPGRSVAGSYAGRALLAVEHDDYRTLAGEERQAVLQDAKRLMREALAPHLGDRPLLSRTLFRRVRTEETGD